MPVPFLALWAQVGTPQRRPVKTPWDKPNRNINDAWLTKHDSCAQEVPGQIRANRRKILRRRSFLATRRFMFHFKFRPYLTHKTQAPSGLGTVRYSPSQRDEMINDACKREVNNSERT